LSSSQFLDSHVTYVADPGYVFENGGTTRTSICQNDGQWSEMSSMLIRES